MNMKKLIVATAIILSPIAAQAAMMTEKTYQIVGPSNGMIGGGYNLDIRWDDFNNFYEIYLPKLKTQTEHPNVAFYGIQFNGELSNEAMAGWDWSSDRLTISNFDDDHGGDKYGWHGDKIGSYKGYIGMRLVVSSDQYTNSTFQIDESKIGLVSRQEQIFQNCEANGCKWEYTPQWLDANDIVVLGLNDYTVKYTHRDAASSSVPEPASLGMIGLAMAGLIAARRKVKSV